MVLIVSMKIIGTHACLMRPCRACFHSGGREFQIFLHRGGGNKYLCTRGQTYYVVDDGADYDVDGEEAEVVSEPGTLRGPKGTEMFVKEYFGIDLACPCLSMSHLTFEGFGAHLSILMYV